MNDIIQYVLDMGAAVFLPIVMIILGLILRMPFKKSFSAALTLGVAFTGMGILIGFMFSAVSPAAEAMVQTTGVSLPALDMGWTPIATIAWAWPYAFFLFPLQIGINMAMIALGWTKCLNVDLWNVWAKVIAGVLIVSITGSLTIAFVGCAIMVVLELKNGDLLQSRVQKMTGIPGITVPHAMMAAGVFIAPLNKLFDRIPFLAKIDMDAEGLKQKIGVFGETHVLGFIIGALIGLMAGWGLQQVLVLAVASGSALMLFPVIAKFFMQALSPFADAATEFMQKRFPNREVFIGLDWPVLAGRPEVWVSMIVLAPVTMIMSFVLPFNEVLAFGGILQVCYAPVALLIFKGNLIRMILGGLVVIPMFLFTGTMFAPAITELAIAVGTIDIPSGQLITWQGLQGSSYIFAFISAAQAALGQGVQYLWFAVGFVVLAIAYVKILKKEDGQEAEEELSPKNA